MVAAHLARRTQQPLWLVTVLPGVHLPSGPSERDKTITDALHLEARVLREQGIEVEVALLHGKVASALGRLCTDVNAGLLVVGESHYRSPLFATPVDRIASGVSVPLLVVRSLKPFEAWAQGQRPLKVLLAIDHTWSSAVARDWLTGLAAYGPLEVVATHIWTPAEEHQRRGAKTPLTEADEVSLSELLVKEAEAALRVLPASIKSRVQLEVGRGHIGELLLNIAMREQVDMMVMGTHPGHRGMLSRLTSVSHEVLANGVTSVTLVPGEGVAPESLARSSPTSPRVMKERLRRTT